MNARSLIRAVAALAPLAALGGTLLPASLPAQERLLGARWVALGPAYELWNLGDRLPQPTLGGVVVEVRRVSQLSVPLSALVPLGSRLSLDLGTGYAAGEVTLDGPDEVGRTSWSLSASTPTIKPDTSCR